MTAGALAERGPYDVVVIGGGINGCGVARELALHGLRVALIEQDDFGFGTTWRSTKLMHGGLRYLEHREFGLVFESLRERAHFLKTRPHLVRRQRFVFPILPWTRRPAWQIRAGLAAYDLMALGRGIRRHRRLRMTQLQRAAPWLPHDTQDGFAFHDARIIAPERLALELALEAEAAGAVIANHTRVETIRVSRGAVRGVEVQGDVEPEFIGARVVVNAAGPWVDAVNELAPAQSGEVLTLTRGAHIVLDTGERRLRNAVISTARADGRVFFAVPQGELLLVGTTDDRYEGDPSAVRPTREDLDYLLGEAQALLPRLDLTWDHIQYAYAGLRPLERKDNGDEESISRGHNIVDHGKRGGPYNLYSLTGGKLSTHRPLAKRFLREVFDLRKPVANVTPATGGTPGSIAAGDRTARRLARYGARAAEVLACGAGELAGGYGAIEGEVLHAVRKEHATTLSDVLMRRTGLAWERDRGIAAVGGISRLMGVELGWNEERRQAEVAEFERDLSRHLPTPADIATSEMGRGSGR